MLLKAGFSIQEQRSHTGKPTKTIDQPLCLILPNYDTDDSESSLMMTLTIGGDEGNAGEDDVKLTSCFVALPLSPCNQIHT